MELREERQRKKRAKHGLLWLAFAAEVTYLSERKQCYIEGLRLLPNSRTG